MKDRIAKLTDEVLEITAKVHEKHGARAKKPKFEVNGYDGHFKGKGVLPSHTDHRIQGKYFKKSEAMAAAKKFMDSHLPMTGEHYSKDHEPWVEIRNVNRGYNEATWRAKDGKWVKR